MRQFTRQRDLESCKLPPPLRALVQHVLAVELSISQAEVLDPDDGAVFLIEEGDTDQAVILAIGSSLRGHLFERVVYLSGPRCYVCTFLRDNQCCITLIFPDREWLSPVWKRELQAVRC